MPLDGRAQNYQLPIAISINGVSGNAAETIKLNLYTQSPVLMGVHKCSNHVLFLGEKADHSVLINQFKGFDSCLTRRCPLQQVGVIAC